MEDSVGGTAKTLMFVNVSPADYNTEETVTSLKYASRVKLIKNDASKNVENRELANYRSKFERTMAERDELIRMLVGRGISVEGVVQDMPDLGGGEEEEQVET